ncbi:MAG: SusD/RagB family nutrient-binding outer membrane lipoprotein, partial [Flavitalea sp.]
EEELKDDASLASFGNSDILFNGNVESWKRLANSLRLRLAIRVRYADPTLAQQHISEVINAPLIEDNMQNAQLNTLGENTADLNNRNPLYNRMIELSGDIVTTSLTVTENLKWLNDPRLTVFVSPAPDGVSGYHGRPLAIFGDEKLPYSTDQTAKLAMSFQAAEYSIIVFNAAETFFLKAEAGLSGIVSVDAQEMFAKGIQASLEQYHIESSYITDYLNSSAGTLSGTEEQKLEQIIVQKWLAIYFESAEAWSEFRRTGYPRIWTGSDKGNTDGNIPRRLTYPQEEYSKNEDNVRAAAARINGDKLLSRIWWDKKEGLPFLHPRQGMFPPEQ